MKSNRKLANIIVKPKQQFLVASYFFCTFFVVTAVLIAYFISSIERMILVLKSTYQIDPELIIGFEKYLTSSVWILCCSLFLFAIIGFFMWLKLSHRIFGPLVPISRHINELKNGNYSSRVQLRKNDFMLELKDELNELAEKLQSKK